MKINFTEPSYEILMIGDPDPIEILQHIEKCGRTCYKSEDKMTEDSCKKFIQMIIKRGHESVLEHYGFSVRFIVDRGISHELVRHRLASFSQESTRYVGYRNEIEFILPLWIDERPYDNFIDIAKEQYFEPDNERAKIWYDSMVYAAMAYKDLLDKGWTPEKARAVLPNSLKTEIVITANLREWRHILKLRTSAAAHPQVREVMIPLLQELKDRIPVVFDDIEG